MAKAIAKKIEDDLKVEVQLSRPSCELQDLSRLELECMRAIWMGNALTVHDVQNFLGPSRPLAYTTVMTILDRLAQKGAVTRRKKGKAFIYAPVLELEMSRKSAVNQLVNFYFEGSIQKLLSYLDQQAPSHPDPTGINVLPEKPSTDTTPQIQDCLL